MMVSRHLGVMFDSNNTTLDCPKCKGFVDVGKCEYLAGKIVLKMYKLLHSNFFVCTQF